jgi:hypothetical protein
MIVMLLFYYREKDTTLLVLTMMDRSQITTEVMRHGNWQLRLRAVSEAKYQSPPSRQERGFRCDGAHISFDRDRGGVDRSFWPGKA